MSVVYLMYFRSRKNPKKKHNSKTLKSKREKQKKNNIKRKSSNKVNMKIKYELKCTFSERE